MRFSAARRSALKRAGAAGLSLIATACERTGPAKGPPEAAGDFGVGALRLDLRQRISGGAEEFTLEGLRFEPTWPGRRDKLADGADWGEYRLSVYQPDRRQPPFRQGFDTSLAPGAKSATTRVSVRFPMPQRPVRASIEKRHGETAFREISGFAIDPAGDAIDRAAVEAPMRVDTIVQSGEPAVKADIAILGDGYSGAEYSKFADDAARAAGYLFSVDPFKARSGDFNVRSVFLPSAESGVTDWYRGLRKNTAFRCAYGTGASAHPLGLEDTPTLRDAASAVPYDFLLVLANSRRYGGSAWFGGPAVVAIDSVLAKYLVIHELAHVIAGLEDEYYFPEKGGPAYAGNVEPWQPNVTISPQRGKWRDLPSGPLQPMRWNKLEYERRFADYLRRYHKLREAGADEAVVDKLMQDERARQATVLARESRRAGYFEGANGYARGMYRSGADCVMFSFQSDYFCAACTAALDKAIDRQCG
jgi:hypothetical protein